MPKTLLVFPPGWSPVGPYLALPVLKSYLQEVEQYKVDIVDLNVEFYDDLLSFRHVEECCKRYRESKDSFSSNVIHNSITVKTHGGCRNETDYFKCIWRPHIRAG